MLEFIKFIGLLIFMVYLIYIILASIFDLAKDISEFRPTKRHDDTTKEEK